MKYLLLAILLVPIKTFANQCPDLSGRFQCQPDDGREPFLMEVSQLTSEDGITTYNYVYGGGVSSFSQVVSEAGEINAWPTSGHYIARCGGSRVNYFTSEAQRLFCWDGIDSDGHYIETVVKNGQEKLYIRCLRVP